MKYTPKVGMKVKALNEGRYEKAYPLIKDKVYTIAYISMNKDNSGSEIYNAYDRDKSKSYYIYLEGDKSGCGQWSIDFVPVDNKIETHMPSWF